MSYSPTNSFIQAVEEIKKNNQNDKRTAGVVVFLLLSLKKSGSKTINPTPRSPWLSLSRFSSRKVCPSPRCHLSQGLQIVAKVSNHPPALFARYHLSGLFYLLESEVSTGWSLLIPGEL
jgi:hypothetical protein